jgi:hypothetical protein
MADVDTLDHLAPVRADDALLDALGGRDSAPSMRPADELSVLFLGWRDEVDAYPVEDLPEARIAVAAICDTHARSTQ